jgi:hypothetical protein
MRRLAIVVIAMVALTALPAHAGTTSTVVWEGRKAKVIEVVNDEDIARYLVKNRTGRRIDLTCDQQNGTAS